MFNATNIVVLDFDVLISGQKSHDEAIQPAAAAVASGSITEVDILDPKQQNAELQRRLAISQADLADMAADACRLLRKIAELQAELAVITFDRDAWRTQAERLSIPLSLRAGRLRRAG